MGTGKQAHSSGSSGDPVPTGKQAHSSGNSGDPVPTGKQAHSSGSSGDPVPTEKQAHSSGSSGDPVPTGKQAHSSGSSDQETGDHIKSAPECGTRLFSSCSESVEKPDRKKWSGLDNRRQGLALGTGNTRSVVKRKSAIAASEKVSLWTSE